MSRAAEELLDGIRVLLRTFTVDESRFPPAEGRIKYNAVDFQTLHYLAGHPGCSNSALAGFLGLSATTTQSVCDRLINRGYVLRAASKTSARAVALSLTDDGESVVGAIRRQDLANCKGMLNALPAGERRRFVSAVSQIAHSLSPEDPDS